MSVRTASFLAGLSGVLGDPFLVMQYVGMLETEVVLRVAGKGGWS